MTDTTVAVDIPASTAAPATTSYDYGTAAVGSDQVLGQKEYSNPIVQKMTSRRAWAIFWTIYAVLSFLVWTIAASVNVTSAHGFAIFTGLTAMCIAIVQAAMYWLPQEKLEAKIHGGLDRFPFPSQWFTFVWVVIYEIFWLSVWASLANVNGTFCSLTAVYGNICSNTGAVIAFAVIVFLLHTWKLAISGLDAFATRK